MLHTFKQLATYMGSRRKLLPISLILSAINGLLSLVPYILLWLIVRTLLLTDGNAIQVSIVQLAWQAFGISVLDVILYFTALMLSHLVAFRVETSMRRQAMQRLMQVPLGYFDQQNSGRMRKVIDEDSGQTHTLVAHLLPDLAGSIVAPLCVLVILLTVDWQLGLAALLPILLAFFLMGFMMNPNRNNFQRRYLDALEKMSAEAVEYVRGIPVVKTFQQSIFSFKRFYNSIEEYRELVIRYTKSWCNPMSAYTVIINAFAFLLVPLGVLLIGHQADPTQIIANMILYVIISPIIAANIMKIMYLGQYLFLASEAVTRLEKLTEAQPLEEGTQPMSDTSFDICFHNVSFRYQADEKDVISHLNLTIPTGTTTALVGPSGGGKTTIARLIPRFWDVCSGSITIGGIDVRQLNKQQLMQNISFVFQNARLFKTTLLENVKYGTPKATLEQVNLAIDLSQSREIIDRLPLGLNTVIGSEGTYLSGGEQQRIVLARAILKDAPIIVLDEATAFADPENEYLIRQALMHLTKGKTVLMIAHRLTTITDAQQIAVVQQGRIVEQGTHQQLLAQQSIYAKMWNEYQQAVKWKL